MAGVRHSDERAPSYYLPVARACTAAFERLLVCTVLTFYLLAWHGRDRRGRPVCLCMLPAVTTITAPWHGATDMCGSDRRQASPWTFSAYPFFCLPTWCTSFFSLLSTPNIPSVPSWDVGRARAGPHTHAVFADGQHAHSKPTTLSSVVDFGIWTLCWVGVCVWFLQLVLWWTLHGRWAFSPTPPQRRAPTPCILHTYPNSLIYKRHDVIQLCVLLRSLYATLQYPRCLRSAAGFVHRVAFALWRLPCWTPHLPHIHVHIPPPPPTPARLYYTPHLPRRTLHYLHFHLPPTHALFAHYAGIAPRIWWYLLRPLLRRLRGDVQDRYLGGMAATPSMALGRNLLR